MVMLARRERPPTEPEAELARASAQIVARYARENRPLKLRLAENGVETPLELPPGAVTLLRDILGAMASGRAVTIIPENAELSTVQAAEMLNVSRPFLIKLLEDGKIPFRRVGKHRRVRMEDVMAYKSDIDRKREAILDQLVREAQEQGMGYRLK